MRILAYIALRYNSATEATSLLSSVASLAINTFYDLILQWNLCGDLKAICISVQYNLPIYTAVKQNLFGLCKDCHTYEIIRMQFSSRTLKIVRTFLDRGSATKKINYHLSVY